MSELYKNDPSKSSQEVESLKIACIDSLFRCCGERKADAEDILRHIKDMCLPPSIIDYIFKSLARNNILEKSLATLLCQFENITLDFSGLNYDTVVDDAFDDVLLSTSGVRRLILDGVYMEPCFFRMFAIASSRLVHFPTESPSHLQHLHVNNCDSLTDQFVSFFADSFPFLESLLISSCELLTEESIISITSAPFCETLKTLDISYNTASSDCMAHLTNLTVIEQLNISHIKCDASFRFIISSPNFAKLWMSSLFVLTDADVRYILSGGDIPGNMPLKKLTELYLAESAISTECLQELVHLNCPEETDSFQLQVLDLSWTNENLEEAAIALLLSRCPKLMELKLTSTDSGEETLLVITSTCQQLRLLQFSRCASSSLRIQPLNDLKYLTELNLGWAVFSARELMAWAENPAAESSALEDVRDSLYVLFVLLLPLSLVCCMGLVANYVDQWLLKCRHDYVCAAQFAGMSGRVGGIPTAAARPSSAATKGQTFGYGVGERVLVVCSVSSFTKTSTHGGDRILHAGLQRWRDRGQ